MAFTALLGTSASRPGNVELGIAGQPPAAAPVEGYPSDDSAIAAAVGKDLRNRGKAAAMAALGLVRSSWDPQPPVVPTMGWASDPSEVASAVGKDLRERSRAANLAALRLLDAPAAWDAQPLLVPAFIYAESPTLAPRIRRRQELYGRRAAAASLQGESYYLLTGFPPHIDLVIHSVMVGGHSRGGV